LIALLEHGTIYAHLREDPRNDVRSRASLKGSRMRRAANFATADSDQSKFICSFRLKLFYLLDDDRFGISAIHENVLRTVRNLSPSAVCSETFPDRRQTRVAVVTSYSCWDRSSTSIANFLQTVVIVNHTEKRWNKAFKMPESGFNYIKY
jgi:hypothetical protein